MQKISTQQTFQQAVHGTDPDILRKIRNVGTNLAVWRHPLSDKLKRYLETLEPEKMLQTAKESGTEMYIYHRSEKSYWTGISNQILDLRENRKSLDQGIKELCHLFPGGEGREDLEPGIARVFEAMASATGSPVISGSLYIFHGASSQGAWHCDASQYRGCITLAGRLGTLWLPDEEVQQLEFYEADYARMYRCVQANDNIQMIPPGDLAVFKGTLADNGRPLVHATPPDWIDKGDRLALVLSNKPV